MCILDVVNFHGHTRLVRACTEPLGRKHVDWNYQCTNYKKHILNETQIEMIIQYCKMVCLASNSNCDNVTDIQTTDLRDITKQYNCKAFAMRSVSTPPF